MAVAGAYQATSKKIRPQPTFYVKKVYIPPHGDRNVKKVVNSNVPASLVAKFEKLPMTRSAAIAQALTNAARDPELLVDAFKLRMSQPFEENDTRITYTRDEGLQEVIDRLSRMTKLPGEQVVRLCMEAYIHKL